jgi:hypothetical protein
MSGISSRTQGMLGGGGNTDVIDHNVTINGDLDVNGAADISGILRVNQIRDSTGSTNGIIRLNNIGIAFLNAVANTARVHFPAGTATVATLNIAEGVDKTVPAEGDLWYNGTNLYFRDGTQNVDLLGAPDVINHDLTINGRIEQVFDGTMYFGPESAGSVQIGVEFRDSSDTSLGRITQNTGTGDMLIETHPGAGTSEIKLNYDERDVTISRLGIGGDPNASFALDVTGKIFNLNDTPVRLQQVNLINDIGLELYVNTGGRRGFFIMNGNTGQISIGGDSGGYTPDIYSNGQIAMFMDNDQNVFIPRGDLSLTEVGTGLIQASPNGTLFRLAIANDGTVSAAAV